MKMSVCISACFSRFVGFIAHVYLVKKTNKQTKQSAEDLLKGEALRCFAITGLEPHS